MAAHHCSTWRSSPRVGSSFPLRTGCLHVAFGKSTHQCLTQSVLTTAAWWTAFLSISAIVWHLDLSEGTNLKTIAYPDAIMGNTEIPKRSWDLHEPHVLTEKWRNWNESSDTCTWFWQCIFIAFFIWLHSCLNDFKTQNCLLMAILSQFLPRIIYKKNCISVALWEEF